MSIEDFLSRLEAVSPAGANKWVARCPAHDDGNPSLGVAVGDDGRILVHCYAGCRAEEIVAAMGLKMSDLMADNGKRTRAGSARKVSRREPPAIDAAALVGADAAKKPKGARDYGKLVCAYDYQDETGAVIFRVERRVKADGKKTFVQMHPDPTNKYGWSYGITRAGVNRVPFRLPRILAAAKAGKSVIVCEGEKDVLTIERTLGAVATCNPGGAGKWQAGWGKYFEGCRCVAIIADKDPAAKHNRKTGKDEPFLVGQRHANDVERLLRADGYTGGIRKFVMPDVGEHKVKDFTDWVEAIEADGGRADRAAFQRVIEEFKGWPEEWDKELAPEPSADVKAVSVEDDVGGDNAPGRFGRLAPRAPDDKARVYEVDFRTSRDHILRLRVGLDKYQFCGYTKDAGGDFHAATNFDELKIKLPAMLAMTFGCLRMFDADAKGARLQSEITSAVCLLWLRARGKFFWDERDKGFQTSLYFDEVRGVLLRVRSDEFAAFVATAAEINRESSGFKYLMSLIDDAAMSDDCSQGVVPSVMWERKGDAVYISNGDSRMYRLSGGAVDDVQNGTDGVVFVRGKTLAPWALQDGDGVDPFASAKLFAGASWADRNGAMNVRLWVLNLFACHDTKPIILFTGQAGSGKTRMAKGIKQILGVRANGRLDLSVQQVEDGDKGLDAFWATVNEGKLEVFDNLDTKIKWVSDALQNAATDGQTKRRQLYTTSGVSILRANAHLMLTSNNPIFSTEGNGGMADRIITISLGINRAKSEDTELTLDITRNRDNYLTWIAKTVAKALADDKPVDESINRRHPDYGKFSMRCGRALGVEREVVDALGSAEADKSLLPLQNDVITREIIAVLKRQSTPWTMRFTGGEMSEAIIAGMGDDCDEKTKQIYGSRRVGKAMSRYLRQFGVIFRVSEPRIVEGRTVYEFSGLTAAGELVMGEAVGSVDLKPTFPKSSRTQSGAGGFLENGIINPPNPPYAHTRPDSSFSSSQGEGKGESINNNKQSAPAVDDLVDDWEIDL